MLFIKLSIFRLANRLDLMYNSHACQNGFSFLGKVLTGLFPDHEITK